MEHKQKDWFGSQRFYLGIDVGRPSHWAVGLKPGGTIAISYRQDRCQENIEALLDEAGEGALVIVDQKNNIGSLIVYRWCAKRIDVGYLPGEGDEVRPGDVSLELPRATEQMPISSRRWV